MRYENPTRTWTLAIILAAGLMFIYSGFRFSRAESEEAQSIKAEFARQVDRIKSLEVDYKLDTRSNLSPEKLRAMPERMNQMFLPRDEWFVAFKGEKRYSRQIQPERIEYLAPLDENGLFVPQEPATDAPPLIKENQKKLKEQYDQTISRIKAMEARGIHTPKRDPSIRPRSEQEVTRGFNGKTLWVKQPTLPKGDRFQVWSTGSKPNFFQVSAYLGSVGLHVPDPAGSDDARKGQAIFQVAERIKDRSYELEPKTEVVDGSTCVILKGSLNSIAPAGFYTGDLTDRLWLDRDHGLVVRKREMARDGRVTSRWVNTDLKEIEPGLWLPMTTRNEQFSERPILELNGKPVLVEELKVQSLTINKVPDERFDMTPKQGDVIEDLRGQFSFSPTRTP